MVPPTIQKKLASLRGRERMLSLGWGVARWLAILLLLLLAGGFVDWLIDRERDTPWSLRYTLFIVQVAVALSLAGFLLSRHLGNRTSDSRLALRVEDRHPSLHHALISAVQLNKPGAATEGMSPELIKIVTRQAEKKVQTIDFPAVADHRRLKWSLCTALPAIVLFLLPFAMWPGLASILLARQFLADAEIPHSVNIQSISRVVWPSGDKVTLKFRVQGENLTDDDVGLVSVHPTGQPADSLALEFESQQTEDSAIFTAEVPPGSTDFTFTARLRDGRLRNAGQVHFEARPIITELLAWVVLPKYCGLDSDDNPYEQFQARGDIVGIPGSSARVALMVPYPVASGHLDVFGPANFDPAKPLDEAGPEVFKRTVKLTPKTTRFTVADGETEKVVSIHFAEGIFELRPDETAYSAIVADENGFVNQPPPRRKVRMVEEEKPTVTLLKEQFPPSSHLSSGDLSEDYEVEGLPVPLGKDIRIAYQALGPYGLGQARLLFRVVKKVESGNDDPGPNPWMTLPLQETPANGKGGPFNPRIGAFENSSLKEQVFFHATKGPISPLPRSLGGGRFDFKTKGILDDKGNPLKLKVGDQIEFCIEVFADSDLKANRPSNRSETRVKTIVSEGEFALWVAETLQEERRIRQLDAKQRVVFEEK